MNNQLQEFTHSMFGTIRVLNVNDEIYFVGKDVVEKLGYNLKTGKYTKYINRYVDEEDCIGYTKETCAQFGNDFDYKILGQRGGLLINESGLYSLILNSRLPSAKQFKRWVTNEVLPSIRKTGGYSVQKTPQTYLEALKELVRVEEEKEKLIIENNHKQDVIAAFSEDITLAEKRQRINQIVKFDIGKCPDRYILLYSEFEKKYHISLSKRMQSQEVKDIKPKIRNKMDLIDRVLHMTDELFELAVTLFETDYKTILKKIEETI